MKLLIAALGTLLMASPVAAQVPKEVLIVNDPLVVQVQNPVVCAVPQLLGFTSEAYTGDMGGNFGVTAECQEEFPESRMCTLEEIAATIAIPDGLTGEAWIHKGRNYGAGAIFDAYVIDSGCSSWTNADSSRAGPVVRASGDWYNMVARCSESRPIACCGVR